jgi:hypothetical protein
MPDTPSIEPLEIVAGDTIAWSKDLSDYPATSHTLTYYFRGPGNFQIVASANGREHSVSVSASTSAAYPSGTYDWQAFASAGSERYKVGEGQIVVKDNPTNVMSYDTRSINKQILDALEATQLANAARPEQQYSLSAAGRNFQFYNHADLIMAIEKYRGFVKQEEDAKKIARGEGTGRNIYVRFN